MYLARQFLSFQQTVQRGDFRNTYRVPVTESPAGGLTDISSDMAPLLRLLGSGKFSPGLLRPSEGRQSTETGGSG